MSLSSSAAERSLHGDVFPNPWVRRHKKRRMSVLCGQSGDFGSHSASLSDSIQPLPHQPQNDNRGCFIDRLWGKGGSELFVLTKMGQKGKNRQLLLFNHALSLGSLLRDACCPRLALAGINSVREELKLWSLKSLAVSAQEQDWHRALLREAWMVHLGLKTEP